MKGARGLWREIRLAAPMQLDRAGERVAALAGETGLLEGEVPFGGLVRVVDEHERRVEAETTGLLDHGLLVLRDEARAEELGHAGHERYAVKDVPGGGDIDAAGAGRDRRHRG